MKTCEHTDYYNKHDCDEEATHMCACCASPSCPEHSRGSCAFGGMGFIEID